VVIRALTIAVSLYGALALGLNAWGHCRRSRGVVQVEAADQAVASGSGIRPMAALMAR